METKNNTVEMLLVEDNSIEVRLVSEVIGVWNRRSALHTVQSGEAAMSFLRREGEYADKPRIGLVLLDLNLPGKTGFEVLEEIKSDPGLRRIPVIILTTSFMESDVRRAYDLHANCYIVKPVDLDEFYRVAKTIENFWLTVAKLPEVYLDGK